MKQKREHTLLLMNLLDSRFKQINLFFNLTNEVVFSFNKSLNYETKTNQTYSFI